MDYISKRNYLKSKASNIIEISQKAKEAKKNNTDVIDASIGMLYDENGKLITLKTVCETLKNNLSSDLSYSNVLGLEKFKTMILKLFLKEKVVELEKHFYSPFMATLGGTGALYNAFCLFTNKGETVLLPSLMWSNYVLMCEKANVKTKTYKFFNENNKLNIEDIVKQIQSIIPFQKQVVILINDPCHNPTGYSLSEHEYDILFKKFDELNKSINIVVLFDIAYIAYDSNVNKIHKIFKKTIFEKHNFLSLYAFSLSKTFGIYGLRIGGLFSINKDKELYNEFMTTAYSNVRATYSCPNNAAINALCKISDYKIINQEIENNKSMLMTRAKILLKYLKKYNIEFYPFKSGFFVTIKVNNSYKINDYLIKKDIFVVPLDDSKIRISIASLKISQIEYFCNELHNAITSCL